MKGFIKSLIENKYLRICLNKKIFINFTVQMKINI